MVLFSDFAISNPKIKLEKGQEYEFVEMANVSPGKKIVECKNKKMYKGGGSKFEDGDTLFARITPCLEHGKIAQFKSKGDMPAFGSTEFFVFRNIEGISDKNFLYYLCLSRDIRKAAEKSMSGASGRQRAKIEAVWEKDIFDPGINNQQKIATILSNYDDLIENNEKRIKILENIAKLIYEEWFVRFKFPGHEKVKMVDSETEFGMIPEGWEVGTLNGIVKNVLDSIKKENVLDTYYYLPIDLIPRKSMLLNETSQLDNAQSSLTKFREGDIIFGSMRSYFHKVILSPFEGITRKTCFVLRPKDTSLWSFSYLTIFQEKAVSYANQHSNGATIPYSVWNGGFENYSFVLPDKETLKEFEKNISPLLKIIMKSFFKNQNLRKTRDFLLPKLISGEIDVSDLDIQLNQEVVNT
jgi:type I restriction enzyme, S subunit